MAENCRYHIGIDLGTTNCVMAYWDSLSPETPPVVVEIPQWVGDKNLGSQLTLPSFVYLPPKSAWRKGQKNLDFLPGSEPYPYVIGQAAKGQSSIQPERVIVGAKSWLSHSGSDAEAKFLPWNSHTIVGDESLSPVAVSALYLSYLRHVWQKVMGDDGEGYAFDDQAITITIPASFSEAAQRLTLKAAFDAGYPESVRLLEEPVAAFHCFLTSQKQEKNWSTGDKVLVVDVGGGTSDFSLFKVKSHKGSLPELERLNVSSHILLGGDNIDRAVAAWLEPKLSPQKKLDLEQWTRLLAESRHLKEKIMGEEGKDEKWHVSIPGSGSDLFAESLSCEVEYGELASVVIEGFFPLVKKTEYPMTRSGLSQYGLPYASDPAITKHLNAFLAGESVQSVLFAGGTLKPKFIRDRLVDQLTKFQDGAPLVELTGADMDLAVGLGAAISRCHQSNVITSYPRSLYTVVQDGQKKSLICVVPKGYTGGTTLKLDNHRLHARLGTPVHFQLLSSNYRRDDFGDVLPIDTPDLEPLPSLRTKLTLGKGGKAKDALPINLEMEIGVGGLLDIYASLKDTSISDPPPRWQLQFSTSHHRSSGAKIQGQVEATLASHIDDVRSRVDYFFKAKGPGVKEPPKNLVKELEALFGQPVAEWNLVTIRSLWSTLSGGITRRQRSEWHEQVFYQLAGSLLRPGYGYEGDSYRIDELWKAFEMGCHRIKEKKIESQWWLMWRRVAGGLSANRQEAIYKKVFPQILQQTASAEMILLAGSLERVGNNRKIQLGHKLVEQIKASWKLFDAKAWALARLSSRAPLYGGPEAILHPGIVAKWAQDLSDVRISTPVSRRLGLFYASGGRRTGLREYDIDEELRGEFVARLNQCKATDSYLDIVQNLQEASFVSRNELFGEDIPVGLMLDGGSEIS